MTLEQGRKEHTVSLSEIHKDRQRKDAAFYRHRVSLIGNLKLRNPYVRSNVSYC